MSEPQAAATTPAPATNNNNTQTTPANNSDLAKALAELRAQAEKKEAELLSKLKEKEEEAEAAKKIAGSYEQAQKKAREEYAQKQAPHAEAIINELRQIVKEEGGVTEPLSSEWEAYSREFMTDPEPLAREMQAVTVSCARGIRKYKEENAALKARLDAVDKELANARAEADLLGEDIRTERRDTKARNRNASLMQPASAATPATPAPRPMPNWASRFSFQEGSSLQATPSFVETRGVAARMTEPTVARTPVPAPVPAPVQQKVEAPSQVAPQMQPTRFGGVFGNSMSNNPHTRAMFEFMAERVASAPLDRGTLYHQAGRQIKAPSGGQE